MLFFISILVWFDLFYLTAHQLLIIYLIPVTLLHLIYKGNARGVMVIVVENGHGGTSSNPG